VPVQIARKARDLEADLAICEAATSGPYFIRPCECGCNSVTMSITLTDGRFLPEDARFIAEAREGWPYAIRRALVAEAEVDRLRNELNILQEQLAQKCVRA